MLVQLLTHGLAITVPFLIAAFTSKAKAAPTVGYAPHPAGPFGPIWGRQRPPGLPASVRPCSAQGAAIPFIEAAADQELRDPAFVRTLLQLAAGESGAMFGRPANNYDNRPAAQRPEGKDRISAWGVFNWNEGAGRGAGHMADIGIAGLGYGPDWQPHDVTPWEEVAGPIRLYGRIWRFVTVNGGTQRDAARGIRTWHKGSAWGESMLRHGRETRRWGDAYEAAVTADHRAVIDRHLRTAGVLT